MWLKRGGKGNSSEARVTPCSLPFSCLRLVLCACPGGRAAGRGERRRGNPSGGAVFQVKAMAFENPRPRFAHRLDLAGASLLVVQFAGFLGQAVGR